MTRIEYQMVNFPNQIVTEQAYAYIELGETHLRHKGKFNGQERNDDDMPFKECRRMWDYTLFKSEVIGVDLNWQEVHEMWRVSVVVRGSEDWQITTESLSEAKRIHGILWAYIFGESVS